MGNLLMPTAMMPVGAHAIMRAAYPAGCSVADCITWIAVNAARNCYKEFRFRLLTGLDMNKYNDVVIYKPKTKNVADDLRCISGPAFQFSISPFPLPKRDFAVSHEDATRSMNASRRGSLSPGKYRENRGVQLLRLGFPFFPSRESWAGQK